MWTRIFRLEFLVQVENNRLRHGIEIRWAYRKFALAFIKVAILDNECSHSNSKIFVPIIFLYAIHVFSFSWQVKFMKRDEPVYHVTLMSKLYWIFIFF